MDSFYIQPVNNGRQDGHWQIMELTLKDNDSFFYNDQIRLSVFFNMVNTAPVNTTKAPKTVTRV